MDQPNVYQVKRVLHFLGGLAAKAGDREEMVDLDGPGLMFLLELLARALDPEAPPPAPEDTLYRVKRILRFVGRLAGEVSDRQRTLALDAMGLKVVMQLLESELSRVLESDGGDPDLISAEIIPPRPQGAH